MDMCWHVNLCMNIEHVLETEYTYECVLESEYPYAHVIEYEYLYENVLECEYLYKQKKWECLLRATEQLKWENIL